MKKAPHRYVRRVREMLGLTQLGFAQRLGVGERTVTRYEQPGARVPRRTLMAIERLEIEHAQRQQDGG